MKNVFSILFTFIFLCACSMSEDMDTMMDISRDMQETTKEAIHDMRPAMLLTQNVEAYKNLISAKTMDQKILYAQIYFRTFEFQVWSGKSYDTNAYRKFSFEVALRKFYADLSEIVRYDGQFLEVLPPVDRPVANEKENRAASAYALIICVNELGEKQKKLALSGTPAYSLLDLIYHGTHIYKQLKNGDNMDREFLPYIEATLDNINLAQLVYNIRYSALILKNIKMLAPIDLAHVSPKNIKEFKILQNMFKKPWQVNLEKIETPVAIKQITEQFEDALVAKKYLQEDFGTNPKDLDLSPMFFLERPLSAMVRNMRWIHKSKVEYPMNIDDFESIKNLIQQIQN